MDRLVERTRCTKYLGNVAEANAGVPRLDLAQRVPRDTRALRHLLRGETQHHAPTAHMPLRTVSGSNGGA